MKRPGVIVGTLFCCLLLLPAAAAAGASGPDAAPAPRRGTLEMIAERLASGEIDYSTALKYKVCWLKRPDLLPEDLRQGSAVLVRCGTPVVLEILENWSRLQGEDLRDLAAAGIDLPAILARPTDCPLTLESATHPILVHYESDTYLYKAQIVLQAAEFSWDTECLPTGFGFLAPPADLQGPDDRYDIYLHPVPAAGGTTYPEDWVESTPWWDKTSWFEVHRGSGDVFLRVTVAHELNHACQAATDVSEPVAVWEHTSSWMESRVYFDYRQSSYNTTDSFQDHPEWPLCGFDETIPYQYGGMLWLEYLCDRFNAHGESLVIDLWERCKDYSSGNANNYFEASAAVASEYAGEAWSFFDLLAEFTAWRQICGYYHDPAYFLHGDEFGTVELHAEHRHTGFPAFSPPPADLPAPPHFFGSNFARFDLGIVGPNLTLYFQGQPWNYNQATDSAEPLSWKVGLVRIHDRGVSSAYEIFDVPPSGSTLVQATGVDEDEFVFFFAVNLGSGTTEPFPTQPVNEYSYIGFNEEVANPTFVYVTPGPGAENPPYVRGFFPDGTANPLVNLEYLFRDYGATIAAADLDGDGAGELVLGVGPDPLGAPNFSIYELDGSPSVEIPRYYTAYGVSKYGVNVAAGDIDGDGYAEVLTGPGPGPMFGPQVRGFNWDNDPNAADFIPGVNFFAYGTLRYGVNVAAGDIDGDGRDEILTGAGPGAVFGPHVRAFRFNGSGVAPVAGVSFFAYGTPKYGVNVSAGDIDGDGFDEIVTGAGPGAIYGPHVRGWNFDGSGATSPIPGVSFFAYGTPRWGVNVGCGDVDGDGMDEILTGPGPSPAFGARVRGFNFDGVALTAISSLDFFAYPYEGAEPIRYGCRVAVAGYAPPAP